MNTDKFIMRNFLTAVLMLLVVFSGVARAELVDRVVAVVNDDIITLSELSKKGQPIFQKIQNQAPANKVEAVLRKAQQDLLSSLIDQLIVEQRAEKIGVTVSDEEVDATVQRILTENNLSNEDFKRQLKLIGQTEETYRASLRQQILQSKLVNYEIRSKVVVTDEKVKEYYTKNFVEKASKDSYHILQIGFTWSEGGKAKHDAEIQAQEVRAMAVKGDDFRDLAKRYSDLPSAVDGGDIGVFKKDELASYMKKTIPAMNPGDISPVIETPAGYQIFKLLSDQGDVKAQTSFENARDEIRKQLYDQEIEKNFQKWVKDLRDQAYIKQLL